MPADPDHPAIASAVRPEHNLRLRALKEEVYARVWRILSGAETAPKYARTDRAAIVEILRETKPGLPGLSAASTLLLR